MIIYYRGKKINISVHEVNFIGKIIGLMFCSLERSKNLLLFDFEKDNNLAIHSFFVFFDFLTIWLDEKNRVVDFKVIKPWTASVKPKIKFRKMIEVPIKPENKYIVGFFINRERFK